MARGANALLLSFNVISKDKPLLSYFNDKLFADVHPLSCFRTKFHKQWRFLTFLSFTMIISFRQFFCFNCISCFCLLVFSYLFLMLLPHRWILYLLLFMFHFSQVLVYVLRVKYNNTLICSLHVVPCLALTI